MSEGADETFATGDEVVCENEGVWYAGRVVERSHRTKKRKVTPIYKINYDGYSVKWDEWISDMARLKCRTEETMRMALETQAAAEEEEAAAPPPPPPPAPVDESKGVAKQRSRTSHPPYSEMVLTAVEELRDRSGSSAVAISKWIKERYPVHETKYKSSASAALKACVKAGKLVKVKASFKLSAKEAKARITQKKRKPDMYKPELLDDLELAALEREKGKPAAARIPPYAPTLNAALQPSAGDIFAIAEFFHNFDPYLLGGLNKKKIGRRKRRVAVTAADLELAVSRFPLGKPEDIIELPPLLERIVLLLLRIICGRNVEDGAAVDGDEVFFGGHAQNRIVWGHTLNGVTWPDILRRHLGAERRFRQRVRDAYPKKTAEPAFLNHTKTSARLLPPSSVDQLDEDEDTALISSSPTPPPAPLSSSSSSPVVAPPAKKRKLPSKRCSRYFPFDPSPQRGDDDALRLALDSYCDAKTPFGALRPEQCVAILRALVDDALSSPSLQRAMHACETVFEEGSRSHKNAHQNKRKIEKAILQLSNANGSNGDSIDPDLQGIPKGDLEIMLEAATKEVEAAAQSLLVSSTQTHCLRRDSIGCDRYHSRYWRLKSLQPDETSVVVRLHVCDERYDPSLSPWGIFDTSTSTLLKSLDTRGKREADLARALDSVATTPAPVPASSLLSGNRPTSAGGGTSSSNGTTEIISEEERLRQRLSSLLARPPPENSSAAFLPWPSQIPASTALAPLAGGKGEDDASSEDEWREDEDEEDELPRRSTRTMTKAEEQPKKTPQKSSSENSTQAVTQRAEMASELAAPWRWSHPTLALGLKAVRRDLDVITSRLNAVDQGAEHNPTPPEEQGAGVWGRLDLGMLCTDALRAESLLTSFLLPVDVPETDAADAATSNNEVVAELDDVDWVEVDRVSEDDYYELLGACSDMPQWRTLWRRAIEACRTFSGGPKEARAACFASLFGSLAQAVERHVPILEARTKMAARLLLTEDEEPKKAPGGIAVTPVFIPCSPTDHIFWARIRGYPWWPARKHIAKVERFRMAIEAKNTTLVVFVGESIQYVLDDSCLEPFLGDADDPHMSKINKSSKKLGAAVKLAQAIVLKSDHGGESRQAAPQEVVNGGFS